MQIHSTQEINFWSWYFHVQSWHLFTYWPGSRSWSFLELGIDCGCRRRIRQLQNTADPVQCQVLVYEKFPALCGWTLQMLKSCLPCPGPFLHDVLWSSQLAVVCHQRSTKRMWGRYRSRVFKKGKEAASHQSYWFQFLCEASDWFVGVSVKQQPSSHRWRKWIQLSPSSSSSPSW